MNLANALRNLGRRDEAAPAPKRAVGLGRLQGRTAGSGSDHQMEVCSKEKISIDGWRVGLGEGQ